MKYSIVGFSFLSLWLSDFVLADDLSEGLNLSIDKSKWKCNYCPDNSDEPWFSEINSGIGFVSNDSYKFGEYNGLYKKSAFLIFDVDAMYRDEAANYFSIQAFNLGLETRSVTMQGGQQGKYNVNLSLDNINRYQLDTARTVYNGTTNQSLPATWVDGATTAAMSSLAQDLHNINYYTKRSHISLASNVIQNKKWNYDIKFNRQTKKGKTPFAAAIGSTFADAKSAVLAKPLDYTTDRFEVSAHYNHNTLNASVSLVNSVFKNNYNSLIWDNAFTTGASTGQISLEPDNQMQQLMLNSQYRGLSDIIINGSFSIAKLTQNQTFLPYTTNLALTTTALPKNSLDANVDVINANANLNWVINEKSKIKLIFEHHEQDNNTERATYSYVTADNALLGSSRANLPYSFRTQKLKMNSSYRFENKNKILTGLEYALYDRTYQEVNRAIETSIWAKYANKLSSDINYSFKVKSDRRKANSYKVLTELSPAENSQLRKYNLADKNTIKALLNVNFTAFDDLFINLNLEKSSNQYSNSNVGLAKSDDIALAIDIQYSINEALSLSSYLQQSLISSTQYGSTSAAGSDWSADNSDTISTIGLGSNYIVIEDELSIGFDFVHSSANGKISLTGATATPLPDLISKRNSLTVYGDYNYEEDITFKLSYRYEEYQEQNWNLDNVAQGSIDNVLNLGEISPNYKIGVLWTSVKYVF